MKIHLVGFWETGRVFLNGRELDPIESQKVWNKSPDGFSWGYGGSGPSQLALAICLKLYGQEKALRVFQDFKWKYITTLPFQEDFNVTLKI
jgi:hypothetical protein